MLQTKNIRKEGSNQSSCSVIHSVTAAYNSEMKEYKKTRCVIKNPSNILLETEYIYIKTAGKN